MKNQTPLSAKFSLVNTRIGDNIVVAFKLLQ